jgi:hypothetical protein
MDIVCANLIENEDKLWIIDYEWFKFLIILGLTLEKNTLI